MMILLLAAIKMSGVLAAALGAACLLRRRSAALRHWVLAVGCLLAWVTPLAGALLPSWHLPAWQTASKASFTTVTDRVLSLNSAAVDMTPSARPATAPPAWPLERALLERAIAAIWLGGVAIGVASIAIGGLRLRALARGAGPVTRAAWHRLSLRIASDYGVTRPVILLQSAHPALLVTWGLRYPKVFLPAAARFWSDERIDVVLRHELAHIRRADWAVLVGASLLRAICWFNPLVWLACRRLRLESERACDDMVLRHGVDGADYATHLVDIARSACQSRRAWFPAPAVAHPSTLEQRIRAMLNPHCDRTPLTGFTRLASTLTLSVAALMVAAAALSATAAPPAPVLDVRLAAAPVAAPAESLAPVTAARLDRAPVVAAAAAQAGRGSISGTMLDQLGGVLPGVEIALSSEATGGVRTSVTDGSGAFAFADLRAGEYTLAAQLPGFQTVRTRITVAADAAQTRRLTLPVGSLEETITVTGDRNARLEPRAAVPRPRPQTRTASAGADVETALAALAAQMERLKAMALTQPGAVRVGGVISAPRKLVHVNPIYPASMQTSGIEGHVLLAARIGVDGYVVEVLQSREADDNAPVHPDLVTAATDAVREWKFTPTLLDNIPVEVSMKVNVQFSLK